MMMLALTSFFSLWTPIPLSYRFSIPLIISILQFNSFSNFKLSYSEFLMLDQMAVWLIILTIIISFMSWAAAVYFMPNFSNHSALLYMITFALIMIFSRTSMIAFYFWFEVSLIPIFLMILGWGYQPERIFAGQSIFLYTIIGSIPLLLIMIWMQHNFHMFSFMELSSNFGFLQKNYLLEFFLLISFLIKFPMFTVHLWLPKAHVEAPVSGSMVLAGTLLKLGGFGMIRLSPLFNSSSPLVVFIILFSLFGGAWVSLLCVTQTDLKILIAYSSVSHMSLAISTLLVKTKLAFLSGFCMLLAHGWTSAALFMGANVFYLQVFSRNINFMKGLLTLTPAMSVLWAAICVSNMAGPPSFNLFTELLVFLGVLSVFKGAGIPLAISAFLSAAYSLTLVATPQQGKLPQSTKNTLSPNLFESMSLIVFVFLSYTMGIFIFSSI